MEHMDVPQNAILYNPEECEIEVEIEEDQETTAAEGIHIFSECALYLKDKARYRGIPKHEGNVNHELNLDVTDCDMAISSQGRPHSPGQLHLEEREPLLSSVAQSQRSTRPRIRRGITPWQQSKLERVFKEVHYPDEITKKSLARRLYMKESEVHHWFKKQRAKDRKYRSLQEFKVAPDGTENISN
ncbi:Homeobox protein unc-4 [Cricetulus griseus]|uniref:Homeobox protein unc-4 n=1 Tax=Cricetulus griseus TaxID=10029 RepID=G3ICX5_CRIGR|nr:Homeobox protein unc-4 [Cricetulus griseus]